MRAVNASIDGDRIQTRQFLFQHRHVFVGFAEYCFRKKRNSINLILKNGSILLATDIRVIDGVAKHVRVIGKGNKERQMRCLYRNCSAGCWRCH